MSAVRIVVGAAIVCHGRVMAARRSSGGSAAPAVAGSWEFPGGKVEPGEEPADAVVREIAEELGCTVRVGAPLDGDQPLDATCVLRVYRAYLTDGEPLPNGLDHDGLRWLGPEELEEAPWVPADRPFLAELRDDLLDGTGFADGNVGGAARVGLTVRRPTGPWSPAVHELLGYLADSGLDAVPRVLGTDERGREVLSHIPGHGVQVDQETVSDALLADAVQWLRRFHDAVDGFRPAGTRPWRNNPGVLGPEEIVCHHDPGAYNWVVDDDRLVGMLDWDMAGPGRPVEDLAFMAWTAVPLFRAVAPADVARRLELMADCYAAADVDAATILDAVDARMTAATDKIEAGQRRGDSGMVNLADVGEPERTSQRLAAMRERRPAIMDRLAR